MNKINPSNTEIITRYNSSAVASYSTLETDRGSALTADIKKITLRGFGLETETSFPRTDWTIIRKGYKLILKKRKAAQALIIGKSLDAEKIIKAILSPKKDNYNSRPCYS